jgi:hypothetical protein
MVPQNAGQGNLIATEERDAASVFSTVVAGPPPGRIIAQVARPSRAKWVGTPHRCGRFQGPLAALALV